jgi:hypothetical protein
MATKFYNIASSINILGDASKTNDEKLNHLRFLLLKSGFMPVDVEHMTYDNVSEPFRKWLDTESKKHIFIRTPETNNFFF